MACAIGKIGAKRRKWRKKVVCLPLTFCALRKVQTSDITVIFFADNGVIGALCGFTQKKEHLCNNNYGTRKGLEVQGVARQTLPITGQSLNTHLEMGFSGIEMLSTS